MKMKKSEITQQCKYLTEEQIQQAIKGRKCIKQWAYICHDKDIDDNGEPKAPHWHIMLQFNDTQDSKYIAKWFGIEEQYVTVAAVNVLSQCCYTLYMPMPQTNISMTQNS